MKLKQWVLLSITAVCVAALPISANAIPVPFSPSFLSQAAMTVHPMLAQDQTFALFTGTFLAGEKPTTGMARIVAEGGHYYLELDEAFSTSDQGPDLHVLLDPTAQPPQSYANQGSTVNLGSLREFNGAQRYPIPDSINPANFQSVVIWCRMANATFGYAPLRPVGSATIQ